MELFLLMGQDYVSNYALGRECHRQRMHLENALNDAGLLTDLCNTFKQHDFGRELVVYASSI